MRVKWVSLSQRHKRERVRRSPVIFKVIYDDETDVTDVLFDAELDDWPWISRADVLKDTIELLELEYDRVMEGMLMDALLAGEPQGNA